MVNIIDLPNEILLHILLMVESVDFSHTPFIRVNGNIRIVPTKKDYRIYDQTYLYKQYYKRNRYKNVISPDSISHLETVCKTFLAVSPDLWKTQYLSHFRKGIPYKRDNYHFKKKYKAFIRDYFQCKLSDDHQEREKNTANIYVSQRNADEYYLHIKSAVDSSSMDDPGNIYEVDDLLMVRVLSSSSSSSRVDIIPSPPRIVSFNDLLYLRTYYLRELTYHTSRSNKINKQKNKTKRIVSTFT